MRMIVSGVLALALVGSSFITPSLIAAPAACSGGTVALTFDDGPGDWTPAVLDWAQATLDAIPGMADYFNNYWASSPICAGKIVPTTNVNPVIDWMGLFYFAHAVPWSTQ